MFRHLCNLGKGAQEAVEVLARFQRGNGKKKRSVNSQTRENACCPGLVDFCGAEVESRCEVRDMYAFGIHRDLCQKIAARRLADAHDMVPFSVDGIEYGAENLRILAPFGVEHGNHVVDG